MLFPPRKQTAMEEARRAANAVATGQRKRKRPKRRKFGK